MNAHSHQSVESNLPAFRSVPRTGVIYVMTEAGRLGFNDQRDQWANLGQGAPETGPLPGSPDRITEVSFSCDEHEYAPVVGLSELRDAVAKLYNQRYRQNKKSKYSRENVAISAGGRLALTRLVSTIGRSNVGHFIPDYTAYEELLDSFSTFVPIPILVNPQQGFSPEQLREEVLGRGLSALLLSNPCNPTGQLIHGEELESWVKASRELDCSMIFDEFYSHYIYGIQRNSISAAEFVDDVDKDPVVIFDGLTKNWRYPGFRVSWTIGPPEVIDAVASAGSFIDGGCARPMQIAATKLASKEVADAEAQAIQETFSAKRTFMLNALTELGIKVDPAPSGGFYCWGDLSELPTSLNTGMEFFQQGLKEKVVTVPGVFFDINPGQRRPDRASRFSHFSRFSFGPPLAELERGMEKLATLIKNAK